MNTSNIGEKLHQYGLVRFSKKTGKIDTSLTATGKGLMQLWALQNTTKTKACFILDLTDKVPVACYIGTADGFPKICSNAHEFPYDIPDGLYDALSEEVKK